MANLNKVLLIGRLTRDPEVKAFGTGTKVVRFGFAVNNRRKNQQSGQWEDDPVFLNCEAWGKTGELVEQYLRKGAQAFLEGRLKLDQWTAQDGQKRQAINVVVDNVQFLDNKQQQRAPARDEYAGETPFDAPPPPIQADEGSIPF